MLVFVRWHIAVRKATNAERDTWSNSPRSVKPLIEILRLPANRPNLAKLTPPEVFVRLETEPRPVLQEIDQVVPSHYAVSFRQRPNSDTPSGSAGRRPVTLFAACY